MIVQATKQVISADGTESLPILTCSVMADSRLPVNQLRWMKGDDELAQTQDSGILVYDTSTNPTTLSPFGMYTCEAITGQNRAVNSTLIAERGIFNLSYALYITHITFLLVAHFTMELVPINGIRCVSKNYVCSKQLHV